MSAAPGTGHQPGLADLGRARDRSCVFPTCQAPAERCDIDHLTAWSQGGTTSLDTLVVLCQAHHRLKHTPDKTVYQRHPDGTINHPPRKTGPHRTHVPSTLERPGDYETTPTQKPPTPSNQHPPPTPPHPSDEDEAGSLGCYVSAALSSLAGTNSPQPSSTRPLRRRSMAASSSGPSGWRAEEKDRSSSQRIGSTCRCRWSTP